MRILATFILPALLVVGCGGGDRSVQLAQALSDSFRPQADKELARRSLASLAADPSPERLREELGTNNLTVFLLTLDTETPLFETEDYEWAWNEPDIAALGAKLRDDLSAMTMEDIRDLEWTECQPGLVYGSFSVLMDYGLRAKFLFRARGWGRNLHVTRLAVARRDTTAIEDGFLVFYTEVSANRHP